MSWSGITSLGELATITGNRLLAGETLESISEESREMQEEGEVGEDADGDGDSGDESGSELHETRVTGILHDRESAKKAIEELKAAGFTDKSILIAMHDDSAQESFLRGDPGTSSIRGGNPKLAGSKLRADFDHG